MKVINEWDGAPAQTPTQIIREWYAEHVRDIENYGIAGPPVDALMSALAPLFSAGPWRYDVENAEHGALYLVKLDGFFGGVPQALFYDKKTLCWRSNMNGGPLIAWADSTIAFATINQPEIPNDHP